MALEQQPEQEQFVRRKPNPPRSAPEGSSLVGGLWDGVGRATKQEGMPDQPGEFLGGLNVLQSGAGGSVSATQRIDAGSLNATSRDEPTGIKVTSRSDSGASIRPTRRSGSFASLQDEAILEFPGDEEAATRSDNDGPTPAIEIPNARGLGGGESAFDGSLQEPGYFDDSTIARYTSKRSSISFDPRVTLDDGDRHALEAPLPKLTVRTRPRGRSMLEDVQKQQLQRQLSRARSETDREEYDPDTGERLWEKEEHERRRDRRYVVHQQRWPFLQDTVDDLALRDNGDNSASLTSRTTASPTADEVLTPDSLPPPYRLSPIAVSSPAHDRPDWFESSSVDTPRRPASRSKSYNAERKLTRRASRRGTAGSNSGTSPATAFLSRWHSHPDTQRPQPDSEGSIVGEYVLGREIGFGGFSVIREATTIEEGTRVTRAVKIVRRQIAQQSEQQNEALQAEYEREVEIWRSLSHEHILPLYAVYVTGFATFAITHLNTGGTLFDAVRRNRQGLEPRLARRYAYQVASALRYLHEDMHIVHRDVKLENCLVDVSVPDAAAIGGSILLCDFGLADYMGEDEQSSQQGHARSPSLHSDFIGPSDTSTNFTGSLPYAAPEMLETGRIVLASPSDLWAFGVLCFAIVAGKLPFTNSFNPRVRMMILNGKYDRALLQAREDGVEMAARRSDGEAAANESENGRDSTPTTPAPEDGGDVNGTHAASEVHRNGTTAMTTTTLPTPTYPSELAGVVRLVDHCLQRSPDQRWSIRECLDSGWLTPELETSGQRPGWAD